MVSITCASELRAIFWPSCADVVVDLKVGDKFRAAIDGRCHRLAKGVLFLHRVDIHAVADVPLANAVDVVLAGFFGLQFRSDRRLRCRGHGNRGFFGGRLGGVRCGSVRGPHLLRAEQQAGRADAQAARSGEWEK